MKNIYGDAKKMLSTKQYTKGGKAYEFRAVPKIAALSSNVASPEG